MEDEGLSSEAEATLNWAATKREFRPVVTAEEARSFYFTQTQIVEFASETDSKAPEFRDHFKFLAHNLREGKPPGVLRLLDVGEDEGRLFRIWERREFSSACVKSLGDSQKTRESLLTLVDGLIYLSGLFPVQVLHVPTFSLDNEGFFVARLPFTTTIPKESVFPGDLLRREITFLDLNAAMPYDEPSRADIFLSYLGNFVCHQLTGQWLYQKAPMTKMGTGVMPERSSLDLDPKLLAVLYGMAPESVAEKSSVIQTLRSLSSLLQPRKS